MIRVKWIWGFFCMPQYDIYNTNLNSIYQREQYLVAKTDPPTIFLQKSLSPSWWTHKQLLITNKVPK